VKTFVPIGINVLLLLSVTCYAQTRAGVSASLTPEIEELIRERKNLWLSDVAIGLITKDSSVSIFHPSPRFGTHNLTDSSIFETGGATKFFTGLIFAGLAEKKKVSALTPVNKYLPRKYRIKSQSGRAVTLLDLIMNRSGLPANPNHVLVDTDYKTPYSAYDVLVSASKYKFKASDTVWRNSDLGYALLAEALSEKFKAPYTKLLREELTLPLKLKNTTTVLSPKQETRLVTGYSRTGIAVQRWEADGMKSVNGIYSSLKDIVSMLKVYVFDSDRLEELEKLNSKHIYLSPDITIRQRPGYFSVKSSGGSDIGFCGGQTTGQSSFILFDKENKRAVVILSNCADCQEGLGMEIMEILERK
jgi:CubicO group peptidase (beta-lactamase class C family)